MQPTHSKYDIGSIHWLPARDKIPLEHLYASVHIDSGCFNHPALILWVNPQETEAIISIITSFGGKDLLLKHPHNTRVRSLYLPIYPSNTHPDNGSRLFLRDDARLQYNSYVNTEHQRTVKTVLLVPPRRGVCTLRKDSYNELVKHIAFHPPVTKSHQKAHDTHNMSRDHGKRPDIVAPAVGERVKPPTEERFVVHVQQALPPRQPQQALPPRQPQQALPPRQPQQTLPPRQPQQTLPPRQVQQPPTTPYIHYNAFNSPYTPSHQTERTSLLQPVRPVPFVTHRPHIHRTPPEAPDESCGMGSVMIIVLLVIFVWVLWRMGNA